MSSNLAYARPVRPALDQPLVEVRPRRVQIVATRAQRRSRPKLVYGLGASAVIFAIFLAQLLITIALSSGAYTITGLQSTGQDLGRTTNALNERLDTLASGQNLQANAIALGMVDSSQAAFLRLSNGSVLGTAVPAGSSTIGTSTATSSGSTDSVPNSLLTDIPLIKSTGGHGDANAPVSDASNTESTKGPTTTASTGSTVPPSSNSSDSGDLPSPVTH
ncbi:MAG TPA: hypothetical protein VGF80_10700 [Galbitalea sp.]|jgi:hypothetical protein